MCGRARAGDGEGQFNWKEFFVRQKKFDAGMLGRLSGYMLRKDKSHTCMICFNKFTSGAFNFPKHDFKMELAEIDCPNKCKFHFCCIKEWRDYKDN